jgi:hypothetical protein
MRWRENPDTLATNVAQLGEGEHERRSNVSMRLPDANLTAHARGA